MPSISFTDPKSFMSKDLLSYHFNLSILLESRPIINMINIQEEDGKIIIKELASEHTMIRGGSIVPMTHHERVKLLIPLSWCLLECIRALL